MALRETGSIEPGVTLFGQNRLAPAAAGRKGLPEIRYEGVIRERTAGGYRGIWRKWDGVGGEG
jgi:hypothetical protein